ncbi:serine/threonine-protein kinase [Myxococcus sp. CA056]|uniref:serine/threonine-protein kinase n=1 Tax=Myxococcus sp. CA056 TaxID=2741740 RepID=UPI0020C60551|nr:serine/threonine-protein kinase [Myxococcus sp. CA056]
MAEMNERDGAGSHAQVSLYGDELEPGALVGPWVVESRAHSGVTASLYRATHVDTRAPAAVKVVRAHFNHVSEVLKRFKQEADTLQTLQHPHIVRVLEYGELRDGRPWLAMEWLEGESLDRWLALRGPFSLAEAHTVMEELGSALAHAHGQDVLHRDLKAQNVMLLPPAEGFTVKLVDFGIAKVAPAEGSAGLTSAGAVLGTPVAMAPEQILGQPVDVRADLYALGVLLYQLLTGKLPFTGESAVEIEEQHLHAPPPRLSESVRVPPALEALVRRCLAKRPDERWPDVTTFLSALRAALAPVDEATWAAGLYLDLRFPASHEDPTDDALDARDTALESSRELLESAGWTLAVEGGNALLAWRDLPSEAPARTVERTACRRLAQQVLTRAMALAGDALETRLYLHAAPGELSTNSQGGRLVSGPLSRLEGWATGGAPGAVTERDAD